LDPVVAVLDEIVKTTTIPSASICVRSIDAGVGRTLVHHTAGVARLDPIQRAHPDHVYDLASVTKALVASTVAASLVEEGTLDLHGSVADHVPVADPRITLAQLLTHSSCLLYTSRAHETVLDLVCRLLLEKKNIRRDKQELHA